MRVLPFTKYSPCGNTTILVRESSLSPADRARVAAEIIAPGHLEAEQAGYVDTAALFARFGLLGEDAAGCIWLHREPSGLRITPFVWVRGTGTTYAETACGSGTLAASIVCRGVYGDGGELSLMQPGGEPLRVVPDGSAYPGGWAAWIGGPVRRIARGDVFVECLDGEGRTGGREGKPF